MATVPVRRAMSEKGPAASPLMATLLADQFEFKHPKTETLVEAFACSMSGSLLLQGRLYLGTSCLCFYSNIFSRETKVMIQ